MADFYEIVNSIVSNKQICIVSGREQSYQFIAKGPTRIVNLIVIILNDLVIHYHTATPRKNTGIVVVVFDREISYFGSDICINDVIV